MENKITETARDILHHQAGILREMERIAPMLRKCVEGRLIESMLGEPTDERWRRLLREAKEKLMDIGDEN